MAAQTQAKGSSAARSEAFVEQQLAKARLRIRTLDVTAALLGFLALTFLFAVVAALADRWAGGLSAGARQFALVAYLLTSLAYLGVALVWPLLRSVNPYYAARKVEQTLPNAKNSVVNWLDLHSQSLPPAFRNAVAARAAKDLSSADIDGAISARRAFVLGGVVLGLFLVVVTQWIFGGREFLSRLGRVFNPFGSITAVTATDLKLIEPDGNLTISVGKAVNFVVEVRGRVPNPNKADAVRLLYRYTQAGPWEERGFDRESPTSARWNAQLLAFQVHNGFWYKVAAGDTETNEYQVVVRSTPLISEIKATYHFRPYLAAADQESVEPNLEALRGTEVHLAVRTNRKVREGKLEFVGEQKPDPKDQDKAAPRGRDKFLMAESVQNDTLHFRFVIDHDGGYRVWFVATEGEANTEPVIYRIKALHDRAPNVVLTVPGKDIEMPANSPLQLDGKVDDDFGITGMKLRMTVDGQPLPDLPFREGKKDRFQLADGSYLRELPYKEVVELDKLRVAGTPLQEKMVLEYWLEATDACDYPPPGPNVGQSKKYKVTLTKKQSRSEAQKNNEDAKKNKEQFNKEQDDKKAQADKQQKQGADGSQQNNGSQEQNDKERENQEKLKKLVDELNKELEKRQKENQPGGSKGEGKPDDKNPNNKGESQPKPQHSEQGGSQKGEGKNEPGKDPEKSKGENKDAGKNQGTGKPGENKDNQPGGTKGPGNQQAHNNEGKQPDDKGEKGQEPNKGGNQQNTGNGTKGGGTEKNSGNAGQQGNDSGKNKTGSENGGKNASKPEKGGNPGGQDKTKSGQPQTGPTQGNGNEEGKEGSASKNERNTGKAGTKGGKGGTGQGEEKPAGPSDTVDEKGPGTGPGKHADNSKDDKNAGVSKPTKELIDQLKNGTPSQQQQAKDALKQVQRNGKPGDREAAAQALKETGKKTETQPGDQGARSEDPLAKASREIKNLAEKLKGGGEAARKAREDLERLSRQAPAKVDRDAATEALKRFGDGPPQTPGDSHAGAGNKGQQGPKDNENATENGAGSKGRREGDANKGKNPENPNGGSKTPGVGGGNKNATPGSESAPDDGTGGGKADPRHQKRAGELLLEKFKDRITPQMLEKAGISPQEWQEFLKTRAREQADRGTRENLPTTRAIGTGMSNEGPYRSTTTGRKNDPLQGGNRAKVPPELREQLKEFTGQK
jgi:hypothetical protein